MSDIFVVALTGLDALKTLDELPAKTTRSIERAVNRAARDGRTMLDREISRQVAFPSGYMKPSTKRLVVDKYATSGDAEAVILARGRPTSLARFVQGSPGLGGRGRKPGLRVEVKPGSAQMLPGAFLIKLRAGTSTETKSNLGLAVRTKDGKAPPGYQPKRLAQNLWLLYGPSVAQVMYSERNAGGAATSLSPDILQKLEDEFWRQMDL